MFCRKCGKEIEEGAAFCGHCGAPTGKTELHTKSMQDKMPSTGNVMEGNTPIRNTKKKKGIIALLTAVILLAAVGASGAFMWRRANDVKEAGSRAEEFAGKKEEYQAGFEMLLLSDNQKAEYEALMAELDSGVTDIDVSRMEQAVENLESLMNVCREESLREIEDLKAELNSFSSIALLGAEEQILNQYLEDAGNLLGSDDLRGSAEAYEKGISLFRNIQTADEYCLEVEQVEVSAFPNIKLYVSAYQPQTGTKVEVLENCLELKELVGGSYQNINIDSVSRLNQAGGLNVCLVADVSGSMYGQMDIVKEAMTGFLNCMQYDVGDRAALITFDNFVSIDSDFTADNAVLSNKVNNIYVGNSTALYDALYVAVCSASRAEGAKCVIAFTDGYDNVSIKSESDVIEAAELYNVPVYLIGIGYSVDKGSLQTICDSTGGYYLNISNGSGMQEIYNAIYQENRELYLIEYTTHVPDMEAFQEIYLSCQDGASYMRCESSFQPSQLQAEEEIYANLVQTDGIANADIEDEVLRIRAVYNEIVQNRTDHNYLETELAEGVTGYLENGQVRCVIVRKGINGSQYTRYYYYEDGNLIFAYLEAEDSHRLYFKDEKIFRWRYASNSVNFTEADNHDNEDSAEFRKWGTFALDEAASYKIVCPF